MQRALLLLAIACAACSGSTDDGDGEPADSGSPKDGTTTGDGGPSDGGTTDFARLSDDFEGGSLDSKWSVHRPEVASVRVESGQLAITMQQEALWFENQEAVLVSQDVTGDFAVEAAVHARKSSDSASAPDRIVHLGGLMARNGESSDENYVFIVVGYDENDLSVETKTTLGGVSTYEGPSWPGGEAELRLCRTGSEFRLFKRALGSPTWMLAATFSRPDLPSTLQVGANAYAFGQPDLTVRFDALTFSATCD